MNKVTSRIVLKSAGFLLGVFMLQFLFWFILSVLDIRIGSLAEEVFYATETAENKNEFESVLI